jgi:GNAT superfamily N-acetyltransferase
MTSLFAGSAMEELKRKPPLWQPWLAAGGFIAQRDNGIDFAFVRSLPSALFGNLAMPTQARLSSAAEVQRFRERYREEMNCQIVHDSIHRRSGWTLTYQLDNEGVAVGFGSVAIGGPWTGKPTLFEFYVLPEHRNRAFNLFEALLTTAQPGFMEIQSNDALFAVMFHAYARDTASEKIVFHDKLTTTLPANGATLRCVTSDAETQTHIEQRQGGPEWLLVVDGQAAGQGGILFHYNRPYGDLYMEVTEPFRRRGLGAWLVQELKRLTYELGAVPGARCNPANIASRQTLQKAGFIPFAHMLTGVLDKTTTRE